MNAPVAFPILAMSREDAIETLRNSLYPGAELASVRLVLQWCEARGKDPMKKPCHIVPMWNKALNRMIDIIMPGINDCRSDAAATGQYVGMDPAEFGPDVKTNLGGVDITYPAWCEVTVYRLIQGQRCPFPSGKVRFLETYATAKRDSKAPNSMWAKRPYGQLEKCAEASALRRAFPDVITDNTVEEMQGREIDVTPDDEPPTSQPSQPSTRADAATAAMSKKARKPEPADVIDGEAQRIPEAEATLADIRTALEAAPDVPTLAGIMNKLDQAARRELNTVFQARMKTLKTQSEEAAA